MTFNNRKFVMYLLVIIILTAVIVCPVVGHFIDIESIPESKSRTHAVIELNIDFTHMLGNAEKLDMQSFTAVEIDVHGIVLDKVIPVQFEPSAEYDEFNNAQGILTLVLPGITPANTKRYVRLHFNDTSALEKKATQARVMVSVSTENDEGQESFKITTENATYYYHKVGAGFSSMVDKEGNDWIGYNPGNGKNRGIPNLVYESTGDFFHPGHSGDKASTSELVSDGPVKATISSEASNGRWACTWDIYPTYAKLTVTKVANTNYWFLYEGTPGGEFNTNEDWFITSSNQSKRTCGQEFSGDLDDPEWACFGDNQRDRVIFLIHNDNDNKADMYRQYSGMTVFGFGRTWGTEKHLNAVPNTFSIGFIEDTNIDNITNAINDILTGSSTGRIINSDKMFQQNYGSRKVTFNQKSVQQFAINVKTDGEYSVVIQDLGGRCIKSFQGKSSGEYIIDNSMIGTGLYIVRVKTISGTFSEMFLLTH